MDVSNFSFSVVLERQGHMH